LVLTRCGESEDTVQFELFSVSWLIDKRFHQWRGLGSAYHKARFVDSPTTQPLVWLGSKDPGDFTEII
jgi:hypothetical protein